MASDKISFTNQDGHELSAILDSPSTAGVKAYAIFAHCFTCSKNLQAVRTISRSLCSKGIAVLRFDFTGLGRSEGDFADTNFSTNLGDLDSAADFLRDNYAAPKLIIGHSLGGAAVLSVGASIDEVEAICTIGAPSNPAHVGHLVSEGAEEIEANGVATVNIGGRPFIVKKQFLDDINSHSLKDIMKALRKPLLVMHSPQDNIVGIDNAGEIYGAAWHPKSFVSLDGADHMLSAKEDADYAGEVIAAWASRYLSGNEPKPLTTEDQAVARIDDSDGFYTEISAGGHTIIADEPAEYGGNDDGPSPYDLVAAGLAACSVMTMKMYAKRKKWDLQEAVAHVQHEKKHAQDCIDCDENEPKIDHFIKRVEITGDLDEKQRKRLFEIASRCPVHKTLSSEIKIESSAV
jgi:uncharacterized OsmC-like protein/esterase/lipase